MGLLSQLRALGGGNSGPGLTVALNWEPKPTPWGGANQAVEQIAGHLRARGHRVVHRLSRGVDCVLLVEPRPFERVRFGVEEITRFKQGHPDCACVHRINECDRRKATSDVDALLERANRVADYTVFISGWLRDYFSGLWFDTHRPHAVVGNGADDAVFNPDGGTAWEAGQILSLVTHHWSDNWNKGFTVYREVDRMIADGELEGFALEVIGNWPAEIAWRAAATHPPLRGRELAARLKRHHLYLTASLWEPCGMHHVEGAQCGLPLVYHADGGGIVEYGRRYGVEFRDDVAAALRRAREGYQELRERVLAGPPSGAAMCAAYEQAMLDAVALVRGGGGR